MANSSMTYVIDKLIEKKYVKRGKDSNDKRKINIKLTADGVRFFRIDFSKS